MAAGSVSGLSRSPRTTSVVGATCGSRASGRRTRHRTLYESASSLRRNRPPMYPLAPVKRMFSWLPTNDEASVLPQRDVDYAAAVGFRVHHPTLNGGG